LKRLDLVLRETRRLDAMLKDFLRFTRADRVSAAPADLRRLVEDVVAFVAPECALRGIELRREYEAGLPLVEVDAGLLKQAVLNLVQNAEDAMQEAGGTLAVRLAREGEAVRIEVRDTGVGIAADDIPRLFELYRTTKPDGTGLGLPTTKRIAEAHGGQIEVESAQGSGSRFALVVPIARRAEPGGP
jgi:signal transduction histidine kinase